MIDRGKLGENTIELFLVCQKKMRNLSIVIIQSTCLFSVYDTRLYDRKNSRTDWAIELHLEVLRLEEQWQTVRGSFNVFHYPSGWRILTRFRENLFFVPRFLCTPYNLSELCHSFLRWRTFLTSILDISESPKRNKIIGFRLCSWQTFFRSCRVQSKSKFFPYFSWINRKLNLIF